MKKFDNLKPLVFLLGGIGCVLIACNPPKKEEPEILDSRSPRYLKREANVDIFVTTIDNQDYVIAKSASGYGVAICPKVK